MLKDKVAIAFSAAALVLSVATFYFANLRVENRLQARLAAMDVRPGDEEDSGRSYIKGSVVGRFSIANAGNRPAIILGVHYTLNGTGKFEDGGFGAEVNLSDKFFPLLMQPRELRILDLAIPVRHVVDNFESGAPSESSGTRAFFAAYRFSSLNSRGEAFEVTSPYLAKIEVTKTGWQRLSQLEHTQYAPIELLAKH